MDSSKIINIVGTEPRPDLEEKFNQWYNETHIPLLLKHPDLQRVTRYKRIGGDETLPPYIAAYEFKDSETFEGFRNSPERNAAMEEMEETWKADEKFKMLGTFRYELIKSWER